MSATCFTNHQGICWGCCKDDGGMDPGFSSFYILSRRFRVNHIEEQRDRCKGKSSNKVTKIIIMSVTSLSQSKKGVGQGMRKYSYVREGYRGTLCTS